MNDKRPCHRPLAQAHRTQRIHRSKVGATSTPLQVSMVAVARDLERARDELDDQAYEVYLDVCRRRVANELDRIDRRRTFRSAA